MSAERVIGGMTWLPWLAILPSAVLLWRDRTRRIGLSGMGLGYVLAFLMAQLSATAALSFVALAVAGWKVLRGSSVWVRGCGHALFLVTAVALHLHIAPGFNNPVALEGIVSRDAPAIRAYLNFDKTLSAVWVVACIAWLDIAGPTARRAGSGGLIGIAVFLPMAALATATGVVALEPKLPQVTWLWLLINIVLVCFAEEVLYRGYLQGGLAALLNGQPFGPALAISASAALFGLSHFGQGLSIQLLSLLAGIGYGIAYRRAGLIGAIAAHGAANLGHFLLLTYPASF